MMNTRASPTLNEWCFLIYGTRITQWVTAKILSNRQYHEVTKKTAAARHPGAAVR